MVNFIKKSEIKWYQKTGLLYASVFMYTFSLCISTALSNVFLVSFILLSLISISDFKREKISQALIYSTFLLFCTSVIGFAYTSHKGIAMQLLETRLALLLLPIIFFLNGEHKKNILKYSKYGFLIGAVLCSVFLLGGSVYKMLTGYITTLYDLFAYENTNHRYASVVGIHATYLSLYFLLASVVLTEKGLILISSKIKILLFALLMMNQFFLLSRIILAIQLLYVVYILVNSGLNIKLKIGVFIMAIGVSVGGYWLIKDSYMFQKVNMVQWELSKQKKQEVVVDSRFARWEVCINTIKEHPIKGIGTGAERAALHKSFEEEGMIYSALSNYNAHNQFLSFTIEHGVIGLLLLLCFLSMYIYRVLNTRQVYLIVFMICTCGVFMVETALNVNAFVTLFALYVNLSISFPKSEKF